MILRSIDHGMYWYVIYHSPAHDRTLSRSHSTALWISLGRRTNFDYSVIQDLKWYPRAPDIGLLGHIRQFSTANRSENCANLNSRPGFKILSHSQLSGRKLSFKINTHCSVIVCTNATTQVEKLRKFSKLFAQKRELQRSKTSKYFDMITYFRYLSELFLEKYSNCYNLGSNVNSMTSNNLKNLQDWSDFEDPNAAILQNCPIWGNQLREAMAPNF